MHTLHVIEEVIAAGESVSWDRSLTISEVAEVGSGSMSVHAMCLPFVSEKASSRRELYTDTNLLVAAERLQVRINVLARGMLAVFTSGFDQCGLLIVALERCGLVVASLLAFVGAVVHSTIIWLSLVKWVASSKLALFFFHSLRFSCVRLVEELFLVDGLSSQRGRRRIFFIGPR
jgi:hypothetical protein